ncbi:hypothetical protein [Streptomyces lutosisoli]|uniref:Uncharacterized protein n=1 Tax=Streptomyces lutosisoli TaxID=2665721 RepID=A0ABW2W145_9ACTN
MPALSAPSDRVGRHYQGRIGSRRRLNERYGWVAGQIAVLTVEFTALAAAVVVLDHLGTLLAGGLRPARA